MDIKTNLANKSNYGGTRSLSAIKYIVVHYTANDGDTDENNGKYFHNNYVGASAHYFVDDDSVTQSVPDNYIAWHCGANQYKHKECRNGNSIGVELCDARRNGVVYPTPATIARALELVEYLMKKYSVPKQNVIRHYDVTGKLCPAYWCGNANNDGLWKSEFWNKLSGGKVETSDTGKKTETKFCAQAGAFSLKKYATEKLKAVTAAGFNAKIAQVGNLWKIHVGTPGTRASAESTVKKLEKAGFTAIVVKVSGTASPAIKVGCTVKLRKGAKTYTGGSLKSFVYNRNHIVKEISGDRVVITYDGIVIAAVKKSDLILV